MLLEKAKIILDNSNIPKTTQEFWGQILVQSSDEIVLRFTQLFKDNNKTLAIATRFLYARLFCEEDLIDGMISSDEIILILDTITKKKGFMPKREPIEHLKPMSTAKMIEILSKNSFFDDIIVILLFIDSISISQVND